MLALQLTTQELRKWFCNCCCLRSLCNQHILIALRGIEGQLARGGTRMATIINVLGALASSWATSTILLL